MTTFVTYTIVVGVPKCKKNGSGLFRYPGSGSLVHKQTPENLFYRYVTKFSFS